MAAGQPRPSEVAQAGELWDRMLALCPADHHEVLRLRRSGLPLMEVAARTGMHEGSVRRILRRLARRLSVEPPAGNVSGRDDR
jgi:RNA polymerase sigma-70 factor (ECF subfamily)